MPSPHVSQRGVVVISIEDAALSENGEARRPAPALCERLLRVLQEHRVPATWAVPQPRTWSLARAALSLAGSELAVLASSSWAGRSAGRRALSSQLSRRVLGARAAGVNVSTLVGDVAVAKADFDLLVKYGITATHIGGRNQPRQSDSTPTALRYGVWDVPAAATWPDQPLWWAGPQVRRNLRRVASERATYHLRIDVNRLAASGRLACSAVESFARTIAELRDKDGLETLPLCEVAARLNTIPRAEPTRSILRLAG